MPSAFDNLFATAGFPDLLSNFGEPVTYTKRGGVALVIDAIIVRDGVRAYEVNGRLITPRFVVRFHSDETLGITAESVNTGGDTIGLKDKPTSDTETTRTVLALLSSEAGVCEVAVS